MLNLYVERMIRERGTIIGLLKAENVNDSEFDEQVKVCGTVERAADCLPVGKYRVLIGKCIYHRRKMPFLVPMEEEVSSSMESSKGLCVLDSSQCELCCKARHSHEFGYVSAFTSLPCAMIQPGNGPFTMRWQHPGWRGACSRLRIEESAALHYPLRAHQEGGVARP